MTESFLGGYLQMIKGEILDDLGGPFVGFWSKGVIFLEHWLLILTLSYMGFLECMVTWEGGGSKVPAVRKTTKTVEIAKKIYQSQGIYQWD